MMNEISKEQYDILVELKKESDYILKTGCYFLNPQKQRLAIELYDLMSFYKKYDFNEIKYFCNDYCLTCLNRLKNK